MNALNGEEASRTPRPSPPLFPFPTQEKATTDKTKQNKKTTELLYILPFIHDLVRQWEKMALYSLPTTHDHNGARFSRKRRRNFTRKKSPVFQLCSLMMMSSSSSLRKGNLLSEEMRFKMWKKNPSTTCHAASGRREWMGQFNFKKAKQKICFVSFIFQNYTTTSKGREEREKICTKRPLFCCCCCCRRRDANGWGVFAQSPVNDFLEHKEKKKNWKFKSKLTREREIHIEGVYRLWQLR